MELVNVSDLSPGDIIDSFGGSKIWAVKKGSEQISILLKQIKSEKMAIQHLPFETFIYQIEKGSNIEKNSFINNFFSLIETDTFSPFMLGVYKKIKDKKKEVVIELLSWSWLEILYTKIYQNDKLKTVEYYEKFDKRYKTDKRREEILSFLKHEIRNSDWWKEII